jgi:hypothetical protein
MFTVTCDCCGKEFKAKDEMVGKRVKCPCGNTFLCTQHTKKQASLGLISLIVGGAALGMALLGCMLYLIIWWTLPDYERMAIIGGASGFQGPGKVMLPVILNVLGALAAASGIVLGIVSLVRDKPNRKASFGIALGGITLVLLLGFWIWTVTRNWQDYDKKKKIWEVGVSGPFG